MLKKAYSYYCSIIGNNRLLWCFLYVISFLSIYDIPGSPVFRLSLTFQWLYLVFVSAFKSTLLTLIFGSLDKNLWTKILKWTGIAEITVLSVINAFSYRLYGIGISRKMLTILDETNQREVTEFIHNAGLTVLHNAISIQTIVAAAALTATVVIIRRARIKYLCKSISIISLTGFILFLWFCIFQASGRTAHSLNARLLKYSIEVHKGRNDLEKLMNLFEAEAYDVDIDVSSLHAAEDVIIVIGESASRNHLSAYGYPLETTPFLNSMKDSVFIFNDAIGSSAGTAGNMERILSFKPDDKTYGDGYRYPLIIDFFKKAGYKTYWFSNQEKVGSVSNLSALLTSHADVIKYVGADNSEDALLVRHDECLLPHLAQALEDSCERRMIFLHLLGSHFEYSNRYPDDFNRFNAHDILKINPGISKGNAETVASYDNSILYTDFILNEITDKIRNSSTPTVLIYFSDHGENVYDKPDEPRRGAKYVRVPFFIYANEVYRKQHPEIIEALHKSTDLPFSTANVVYPLMTLTKTVSDSLYKANDDILSPMFVPRIRYVDEEIWTYDKD